MANNHNTLQVNKNGEQFPVNTPKEFPVSDDGPHQIRTHHFCSIRFTNAAGASITPGAGTYTIAVKTVNNPVAEAIPDGSLVDATAAQINLSVAAPVTDFVVTTTGITTATHFIFKASDHRD